MVGRWGIEPQHARQSVLTKPAHRWVGDNPTAFRGAPPRIKCNLPNVQLTQFRL